MSQSSYSYAGGPAWRVIGITEATGPDPSGRFTQGRNVTYQLASGLTGTVFIPLAGFTEDTVAAAVNLDAQTLHNVSQLSSG
jgi:hypothetical protein